MTPEEEINHWKAKSEDYRRQYEDVKEELEEFQMGSRELELELEMQLEQFEKRNKDLTSAHDALRIEYDNYREKSERDRENLTLQLTHVQDDFNRVKSERDEMHRYIRELEQVNDDLERTKRSTVVSLEDFESRLNQAIERNAFLESELDEKEMLVETVQRLKDEARDLRQELDVRRLGVDLPCLNPPANAPASSGTANSTGVAETPSNTGPVAAGGAAAPAAATRPHFIETHAQTEHIDSNRLSDLTATTTASLLPQTTQPLSITAGRQRPAGAGAGTPASPGAGVASGGTPLTPSMRISALNLVSDLLRKVGALESKLASCRNYSREGRPVNSFRQPQQQQLNGSFISSPHTAQPPTPTSVANVVARGKPLVRDSPVKVTN